MHDLLKYELCSLPTCRFDSHMLMRTGDKIEMHYLVKRVPECIISTTPSNEMQFIRDWDALVHKFSWPKNSIYADICMLYNQYVINTYSDTVVVLDGYYGGASTNDETHRRGAENYRHTLVNLSADRLILPTHQAMINLIALYMSSADNIEEHFQGDACWHVHLRKTNQQLLLQTTLVCFSCWYTMLIPPITLLNNTSCIWGPPERSSPLKLSRITWTIPLYDHCSSCMRLLVAIPHRGLTGLER